MEIKVDREALWTVSDLYFAVEELLSDPHIERSHKNELTRNIIGLCTASPRMVPKLWKTQTKRRQMGEWKRLIGMTNAHASGHPDKPKFDAWLAQISCELGEETSEESKLPLLSANQLKAWSVLEKTSRLYFSGKLRHARIQPRTSVLIAGPSGAGKSHLVRTFAAQNDLPCLKLTYGDWIPAGAKNSQPTQERICEFLNVHDRALIVIDELDKIHSDLRSEWSTAIMNDLFALLDRTIFTGQGTVSKDSQRASRRLKDSTFIVGCGTWQHLWNVSGGAQKKIGFQTASSEPPMPGQIRAARSIAPELLNRFCPDLILLEPMTRGDFEALIEADDLHTLASQTGIPIDLDDAVASGLGMRWLEALSLRIHLALDSQPVRSI